MTLDVLNPRTGVADYAIEPMDTDALAAASARLRDVQEGWSMLSPDARAEQLAALADAIAGNRHELEAALIADTGRARISRIEIDGVVGMLRRWARMAPKIIEQHETARIETAIPGITAATRLVPYPLVGVISPWNFPLTLALIDAVPALAAGCAVIVKPSEVTPRFIRPLMRIVESVPALAGVLLIVEGDGATGAALVERVDYVAFTGSVATGRKVAEAAARAFIPASLELGGKDPMLVLGSADPAAAARIALRASVLNTGQACQSIERIYVDRAIADEFLRFLVAEAECVRLNQPDIATGDLGPFIFQRQADIVQAQIDDAVANGARILSGGTVEVLGGGKYLRPTILVDVTAGMKIMREETFGPVLPVGVFSSIDEAIELANDSEFGLSASVIAGSVEEAEAVATRLRAGAVSINDGSLTAMIWEAEKSSFGMSGMGPSRMGESGIMRFFRKQALLRQSGTALPLAAYAEDAR